MYTQEVNTLQNSNCRLQYKLEFICDLYLKNQSLLATHSVVLLNVHILWIINWE